jgi:hypothetical protein
MHIGYLGFAIPYKVSLDFNPSWKDVIVDNYISLVFVVDMIVTLLTPISDAEGKLIYDKKKIA